MRNKTYIIDTSVLAHDPRSYLSFKNSDVIIPINVLDELDKLKTFPNDAGKNSRICIRLLDETSQSGEIHKGIKVRKNTIVKVDTNQYSVSVGDDKDYVDNKIISCALELKKINDLKKTPHDTIVVSRDINLRIRARSVGLLAEGYDKNGKDTSELYNGHRVVISEELGELMNEKGHLDCVYDEVKEMFQNEYIHFQAEDGSGLAIGRRIGDKIQPVKSRKPFELELGSKEQAYLADAIYSQDIDMVSCSGAAGTGKTLVAIACALDLVLQKKQYDKLVLYKPVSTLGNQELGFLPGSKEEKLAPFMQSYYDAFEFLLGATKKNWESMLQLYLEKGLVEMDSLAYIRGRSLPNQLIICDEAASLTNHEIKSLCTRMSHGSKLILLGDIYQIDGDNKLDALNNGLTYVIEKLKEYRETAHITLQKGERGGFATLAASVL